MAQDKIEKEKEIERLAQQTGRLIREADPATQQELREAASAMMREESSATSAALFVKKLLTGWDADFDF